MVENVWKPQNNEEKRREQYQKDMELELLTESRLGNQEWVYQAVKAAEAYNRAMTHSDPNHYRLAMQRMMEKVFSIAEVRRAAKERWVL